MKRCSLLLSLCTALCLSIVGCGGTEEVDTEQQPTEQVPPGQEPGAAEEQPQAENSGETEEGNVQALGKSCSATCTVQKLDPNAWCPATVAGYGRTTFLGGCNKACDKALADARTQALPAGCAIYSCSTSGC